MLGFGALSSSAISGLTLKIVSVPIAVSASIGLAFPVSVTAGQTFAASATINLSFGASATALVRQAAAIEIPLSFSISGALRDYGSPIKIAVIPQSYDLRASPTNFALKALPESFTLRGFK